MSRRCNRSLPDSQISGPQAFESDLADEAFGGLSLCGGCHEGFSS